MSTQFSDFDEQNPYAAPKVDRGQVTGGVRVGSAGPAEVRFGRISDAFKVAAERQGTWALIILVFLILSYAINFGIAFAVQGVTVALMGGNEANADNPAAVIGVLFLMVLQFLAQVVVGAYFTAGLYKTATKQIRGGSISVGDLFSGGDVTGQMVVATIGVAVLTLIGFLLLIIPGFIVIGRLILTYPLVADGRLKATDAMKASWNALRGQTFKALVFNLLAGLVAALGLLLLIIGYLITGPVYFIAISLVYADFFLNKPAAAGVVADRGIDL